MRIGIGLPAAIPGAPGQAVGEWAATAEDLGFESVGVIDRLVYDNLDPLVALAVAAVRTERCAVWAKPVATTWCCCRATPTSSSSSSSPAPSTSCG